MGRKAKAPSAPIQPKGPLENEKNAMEMDTIVNHSKYLFVQIKKSRKTITLFQKMENNDRISAEDNKLITEFQKELLFAMKDLDETTNILVKLLGLPAEESERIDVSKCDSELQGVGPLPNKGMGILNKLPTALLVPIKSVSIPVAPIFTVADGDVTDGRYKLKILPTNLDNIAEIESMEHNISSDKRANKNVEDVKECYEKLPVKIKILNYLEMELKKRQFGLQNIIHENEKLNVKRNSIKKGFFLGHKKQGAKKSTYVQAYMKRLDQRINEIGEIEKVQTEMKNTSFAQDIKSRLKTIEELENIVNEHKVAFNNEKYPKGDIKHFLEKVRKRSENVLNFDGEYQKKDLKEQMKHQGLKPWDDCSGIKATRHNLTRYMGWQMQGCAISVDPDSIPFDEIVFRTKSEICCMVEGK